MLHINTKNPSNIDTSTSSKPLFAFKPRQVVLAEHNRSSKMDACVKKEEKSSKIASLTPESKAILHQSILHYLHRNGFSKTLKRFKTESQIQTDTWETSSFLLEDIFCKYNACNADTNLSTSKKPELGNDEATQKGGHEVGATDEETTAKKKRKKKGTTESENGAIEDQSKVTDKKMVESGKNCGQIPEDIVVNEPDTKPKKKKKTKHNLESHGQSEEAKSDVLKKSVNNTVNGLEMDDSKKKTKNKKKKGIEEDKLEPVNTTENESVTEVERKERKKKKKSNTDSAVEDDKNEDIKEKSSKKRKRSSDENDHLPTEVTTIEESKRQKTETPKKRKSRKEGGQVNEVNEHETSDKQFDGQANGKLEINGGEKSGSKKSTKKQHDGPAEPKTVNAFQRVKIDQVEFADKKLQDNSYWAKDGAEIGFGAKAQEVLGQVRGRDFRHEKTKKKRGSYRGGLIDLQSHSVKFNYSDED